jgi:hypothetical protein
MIVKLAKIRWTLLALTALALINWAATAHADPAAPPPPAPVAAPAPPGMIPAVHPPDGIPPGNDTAVAQLPGGESYSVSLAPDPPMTDNDVDDNEMLVIVDW